MHETCGPRGYPSSLVDSHAARLGTQGLGDEQTLAVDDTLACLVPGVLDKRVALVVSLEQGREQFARWECGAFQHIGELTDAKDGPRLQRPFLVPFISAKEVPRVLQEAISQMRRYMDKLMRVLAFN